MGNAKNNSGRLRLSSAVRGTKTLLNTLFFCIIFLIIGAASLLYFLQWNFTSFSAAQGVVWVTLLSGCLFFCIHDLYNIFHQFPNRHLIILSFPVLWVTGAFVTISVSLLFMIELSASETLLNKYGWWVQLILVLAWANYAYKSEKRLKHISRKADYEFWPEDGLEGKEAAPQTAAKTGHTGSTQKTRQQSRKKDHDQLSLLPIMEKAKHPKQEHQRQTRLRLRKKSKHPRSKATLDTQVRPSSPMMKGKALSVSRLYSKLQDWVINRSFYSDNEDEHYAPAIGSTPDLGNDEQTHKTEQLGDRQDYIDALRRTEELVEEMLHSPVLSCSTKEKDGLAPRLASPEARIRTVLHWITESYPSPKSMKTDFAMDKAAPVVKNVCRQLSILSGLLEHPNLPENTLMDVEDRLLTLVYSLDEMKRA